MPLKLLRMSDFRDEVETFSMKLWVMKVMFCTMCSQLWTEKGCRSAHRSAAYSTMSITSGRMKTYCLPRGTLPSCATKQDLW